MTSKTIIAPLEIDISFFEKISNQNGPTSVSVEQFFVSYNSVITIAFNAFSRTLLNIKSQIESALQEQLKIENNGSKWPKTTLGCLTENIPLTDQQIWTLRSICVQYSTRIQSLSELVKVVNINELKLIVFQNRTLENNLLSIPIKLTGIKILDDTPTQEHKNFVKSVMMQFDKSNHQNYCPELVPNNRTIRSYYRKKHIEATLITNVLFSEQVIQVIHGFQNEINMTLPKCFSWFKPESWHMTIRTLVHK